jgi:hypothetical protein
MGKMGVHSALATEEADAIRAQLTRILESEFFRSSPRCCRFLSYSVLNLIEGGSPGRIGGSRVRNPVVRAQRAHPSRGNCSHRAPIVTVFRKFRQET